MKNKKNSLAPICLFTYNRLAETELTVKALKNNYLAEYSDLIIFSDSAKSEAQIQSVLEIRQFIRKITGFKTVKIIESKVNKGLANSIISGVNQIIKEYGKIIVLEDDLETHPNFLNFMNNSLEFYSNDKNIQSINGFSPHIKKSDKSVYFQQRPFPWGWATWNNRWSPNIFDKKELIEITLTNPKCLNLFKNKCGDDADQMFLNSLNGKNDSWYIRWAFNHFMTNRYSVYPNKSLVNNIGYNENGTHCSSINSYKFTMENKDVLDIDIKKFIMPPKNVTIQFLSYFTFRYKIIVRFKLLFKKGGLQQVLKEFINRTNV